MTYSGSFTPYISQYFCNLQEPSFLQFTQSNGCVASIRFKMLLRAFLTSGDSVHTTMPSFASVLHAVKRLPSPSTSQEHILQSPYSWQLLQCLAGILSKSSKQNVGMKIPSFLAACKMVLPSSTSTTRLLIFSVIIALLLFYFYCIVI